jgi:hypothetical protein
MDKKLEKEKLRQAKALVKELKIFIQKENEYEKAYN